MQKNAWKTVTWVIEIVFLLLAFTAPLNPVLDHKIFRFYLVLFLMIGLGGHRRPSSPVSRPILQRTLQ